MKLPENLSLPMVSDVMAAIGVPIDERNVGRALQGVVIAGVEAPEAPGGRWRIPRRKLVDVCAACLHRRRQRAHDRWAYTLDGCVLDVAQLLMRHDELSRHVPERVARQVVERREARARAENERRRRIEEDERRRLREEREAWRRKQEEQRRHVEEALRERERQEHERVMTGCYNVCYRAAFRSLDLPFGDKRDLPEYQQLRRDFPYDRPAWWAPPPGLYEVVKEHLPRQSVYGYVEPDWSKWVPPYAPGEPWPWRKADAAAG